MKKQICAVAAAFLLLFALLVPVSAQEGKTYVFDEGNFVGDAFSGLNRQASELSDEYGVQVTVLIANGTDGMRAVDYAGQIYRDEFGADDGLMLIYDVGENVWDTYLSGETEDTLTEDDVDALWNAFAAPEYYDASVEAYLNAVQTILAQYYDASSSEPVSAGVIPSERLKPRLVDEADLLTDSEETALLAKLDEISERQQFDVAVVTVNSLGGKTPEAFADDYYDYNGYGYGENADGALLLISMEDRDWHISTCGYGITAITDAGRGYMQEQFKPALSDGDYSGAFTTFAELCDEFVTQAKTGEPYDVGNLPKGTVSPIMIVIDLVLGLVIGYAIASVRKSKLKSVRNKVEALDYTVPGSMMLTDSRDIFLNKTVTTRTIHHESSSSGGGSSTHTSSSGRTHTSSSGRTHGGGGGKF